MTPGDFGGDHAERNGNTVLVKPDPLLNQSCEGAHDHRASPSAEKRANNNSIIPKMIEEGFEVARHGLGGRRVCQRKQDPQQALFQEVVPSVKMLVKS